MSQHDKTHACPNCGRPLLGPALSSVGIGDTILLRGCGECLPGAIFDALRHHGPMPAALSQEALDGTETWHEAADTSARDDHDRH